MAARPARCRRGARATPRSRAGGAPRSRRRAARRGSARSGAPEREQAAEPRILHREERRRRELPREERRRARARASRRRGAVEVRGPARRVPAQALRREEAVVDLHHAAVLAVAARVELVRRRGGRSPSAAPSRAASPTKDEVPLRCMPSTSSGLPRTAGDGIDPDPNGYPPRVPAPRYVWGLLLRSRRAPPPLGPLAGDARLRGRRLGGVVRLATRARRPATWRCRCAAAARAAAAS